MEEERDAAERVKRDVPILVILGNPPYNSFAGIAKMEEERDLTEAYRTTQRAPAPQGQGLNDLYVRFFRMAERRIVQKTGRGVVCLISNYSWLDGLSFTGMRERYLEAYDAIWIDNLHGDRIISEYAPDGRTSETVFAVQGKSPGIKIGTAISLLVSKQAAQKSKDGQVFYRDLDEARADDRRQALVASLSDIDLAERYATLEPLIEIGLPFKPRALAPSYLQWPLLPELFPASSPGINTSRDLDLVEIDFSKLHDRMSTYFDTAIGDHEVRAVAPSLMTSSGRYDSAVTRRHLLQKGLESGYFVPYCYRPFDVRHAYWHPETKLLDEKREDLFAAYRAGNLFLTGRQKAERQTEGTPFYVTRNLSDRHLTRPGCNCFPLTTAGLPTNEQRALGLEITSGMGTTANLSVAARTYLTKVDIWNPDADPETVSLIWMHTLAIGYSPLYLHENMDGIRQDWPRIPLPDSKEALLATAALGRQIAALLESETDVEAVHESPLEKIAPFILQSSMTLNEAEHFAVTAGWGHAGQGGVTMPGKGKLIERDYTEKERASLGEAINLLGERTCDVYLNEFAWWSNIPLRVWEYTIGGYQVIKKWLSYREKRLLARALSKEEVRYVQEMARRIAAILLLEPALDESYRRVKEHAYPWGS